MAKQIFVTGTGTDVGKTFVTGLLVKKLREQGKNPAYFKAAMSGNDRDEAGRLLPGDALFVKNISGIRQPPEEMCPYLYERAVSPHLAARIEGNPVRMETVTASFRALQEKYDYITVEGSGGILCPLRWDQAKLQLEDVVKELELSCLLVADAGLGTINAVCLTAFYMREKHIPLKGILLNRFHPDSEMERDNLVMCQQMTGLKVLACVKDGDTDLDMDIDALTALYD